MDLIEEQYNALKIKYDSLEKENAKSQEDMIIKKGENTEMEG